MQIGEHVAVEYAAGEIVAKVKVAALIVPELDAFKANVESGAIDPIKGTDLDKTALLKAVELIKAEVLK